MSKRNQLRLGQICLLISVVLHWVAPAVGAYLAPFLFAYMAEYAIRVVDDKHMPFQDFHALVHAALTLVFGVLLWALSMYFSGQEIVYSAVWFWPIYLILAYALNKYDIVWTHNKANNDTEG